MCMGEDSYLDSYWEDQYESRYEEPNPYHGTDDDGGEFDGPDESDDEDEEFEPREDLGWDGGREE